MAVSSRVPRCVLIEAWKFKGLTLRFLTAAAAPFLAAWKRLASAAFALQSASRGPFVAAWVIRI